jgi:hypothetical protein
MQLTPHVGDRTAPIRARWGSKVTDAARTQDRSAASSVSEILGVPWRPAVLIECAS